MSKTSKYEGSGLGLSIVKAYVELLGGKVWVESKKYEGSTFYFTIPYKGIKRGATTEVLNVSESLDKENNLASKTILVAEDDETSSEYLEIINNDLGIKTIRVKNGEEAINACKENSTIELVLMDINMPVINGYEATKAIKKFKPHLPIIAQTAYAISGDREKSLEAGCDDHITKPVNEKELFAKYAKYLN
jgi:CheY-like chemotaxis protein